MSSASTGAGDPGLPAGWGIRLDRRTRRPRRDLLVGGFPTRALRLTTGGARLVEDWTRGGPVSGGGGARRLARLLTDRGIAHPVPGVGGPAERRAVTVVIPVRDRAGGLAATLAGLGSEVAVIVVDDGSLDPDEVAGAAAARPGTSTTVVRHPDGRGPGAARNTGWRLARPDLVAMVDADVELAGSWLSDLGRHFEDPTVGAVAPRVAAVPGSRTPAWLTAYEAVRSPLDLGRQPAPVRPRSRVAYVPTTALIVRRQALADVGGFDESLTTGEDVDLIWRLVVNGWRVRYDPSVVVGHPTRDRMVSWARQRFGYGRSAAPLHVRHGDAVAPLVISPWNAVAATVALTGHPGAAVAVSAAAVATFVVRMDRRLPGRALARVGLLGQAQGARATAEAVRRVWWPLAAVAAVAVPRTRPALLAAVTVPPLLEWVVDRPALDVLRWTLLYLADDLAYGAGVWAGVVADRRLGALRPVWVRAPRASSPETPC